MEASLLKRLDIRLLIISRGRAGKTKTQNLLPQWVEFLVPESELSDYGRAVDNPLIAIPDDVITLGSVRNYVLDNFGEKTLVMLDDDIEVAYCLTGEKSRRVEDPDELIEAIVNLAIMSNDMGVHVFGFGQSDIRKYKGYEPFSLCTWVGTMIGVIGRKYRFADGRNKVDVDYCMQAILVDRVILVDSRYWLSNVKNLNQGGTSITKTNESESDDYEYLFNRWGKWLKRKPKGKSNRKLSLIPNLRKQSVQYE